MSNARSLFRAGQLLGKRAKSAGPQEFLGYGAALIALAHEESIKAAVYALVGRGLVVISTKPVKGAMALHPSRLTCHACKQEFAAWDVVTGFVSETHLGRDPTWDEKERLAKSIIDSPIPQEPDGYLLGMGVEREHLQQVKRYLQLGSALWGIKETGLYVESWKEGVQSPSSFPPPLYDMMESIVGAAVMPQHPFEGPDADMVAERIRRSLLPEDLTTTPTRCPHRKATRGRALLTLESDTPSDPNTNKPG